MQAMWRACELIAQRVEDSALRLCAFISCRSLPFSKSLTITCAPFFEGNFPGFAVFFHPNHQVIASVAGFGNRIACRMFSVEKRHHTLTSN
jgi:hypothetical protein